MGKNLYRQASPLGSTQNSGPSLKNLILKLLQSMELIEIAFCEKGEIQ